VLYPREIILVFNESASITVELVTLDLTDCDKEDFEIFIS